jgi:hypothetical protein
LGGRPRAGDRLDYGTNGSAVERRYNNPMLGEADKVMRQQGEIGSDADNRAAQLHRGGKFGAVPVGNLIRLASEAESRNVSVS